MILINRTYEIWDDSDIDAGDTDNRGFTSQDEPCTFHELVDYMKEHTECSCYPASGCIYEWLSNIIEPDYYQQMELEINSVHYSRNNLSRNEKYWRLAMKAAGIIK